MFVKKQDLVEVKESLDAVAAQVQQQHLEVAKLKEANQELTQELDDSRNRMGEIVEHLSQLKMSLQSSVGELQEDITAMKVFLSQTKKELTSSLLTEFSSEVKQLTNQIIKDLEAFTQLKSRVQLLSEDLGNMKIELHKFLKISSEIKEGDFNLSQHAKNLNHADQEKLELMKKIDQLERLVAKQRRTDHQW